MKIFVYSIMLMVCILATGCVKRTVSVSKGNRNPETGERLGARHTDDKVVEDKTVWIWQKEFRNP